MLTLYVFDTPKNAKRKTDQNRWRAHSTYYDTNLSWAVESAKRLARDFGLRAKVIDSHFSTLFDTGA